MDPRFTEHPAWRLYGIESYIAVPLRRRDGDQFGVLCALDPLPAELTEGAFTVFHLLADLIAFELEADEQQRHQAAAVEYAHQEATVRDQFLASLAHDLKNPLTSIFGYAGLVKRLAERGGSIPADQLSTSVEQIRHSAARMAASIDELLDLTRLQLHRALELHREPTDVVALVREVAAEQPLTERHCLRVDGVASLVGMWDRARLTRVMQNLIGNAVRYSPDGGVLTVTIDQDAGPSGDRAVVRVVDQGVGIPPADLPHIFDQFRRGSNVIGRVDGTGVGLFSVRQIVEQHGGAVTVDSHEGQGSTFTISLPL
jgi:signal transduction histidine kinase